MVGKGMALAVGVVSLVVFAFTSMLGAGLTLDTSAGVSLTGQAADASFASTGPSEQPPALLPGVRRKLIPFGKRRKRQMALYSKRHYGDFEWRLLAPRQIVLHMAEAPTTGSVYNTFAENRSLFGQSPGVCTHFVVGPRGGPIQFVGLRTRCRHVTGLNHVAIGIEHVGYGDRDLMGDRRQLRGSLQLVRRLRCLFDVRVRDVIGHNESLRSPFYRERVRSARGQTSADMKRSSMRVYRRKLARLEPCPEAP